MSILGFDIGGTKTAVLEGNAAGEIFQRIEIATEAGTHFDRRFPDICTIADRIIHEAAQKGRSIKAVSVSIGGPLRIGDGVLIDPPHLPGWHRIPLKARLEQRFPGIPVFVEHDGNAGALAEFYFGAGKNVPGLQHLVFLTFGTGLGAGIIVNGSVLHGASDTAGEVGHWRLAETGPVGFGKEGSWEGLASGAGLAELAERKNPTKWPAGTPIRAVVDAILDDDPEALEVAAEVGRWLGRGMALLVDALNPQLIVLGSLAVVLGDRVLEPARRELAREALPQAVAACKVVPAALGKGIGDVAALMAAVSNFEVRVSNSE